MGGVSAAVSKTAAAPIERVKLLIQNQVCSIEVASGRLETIAADSSHVIGRLTPQLGRDVEVWSSRPQVQRHHGLLPQNCRY